VSEREYEKNALDHQFKEGRKKKKEEENYHRTHSYTHFLCEAEL
jgi:hypothetical protein